MGDCKLFSVKKIFIIILFLFLTVFNIVSAEEIFKIKGVSYDTSASSIFINTLGAYQESITNNINFVKVPEIHKIYFDIKSSVLLSKKQDIYLSEGNVKQFKISQYSTNPNIVRVVLIFNDDYPLENVKIGNINNNIVIITKEFSLNNVQFYQNTYRDKPKASEDYCNSLIFQTIGQVAANNISQVHQAFDAPQSVTNSGYVKHESTGNIKLRSKYFINSLSLKNNGFLINGYGAACIQKPLILTNPDRMVFDFVNSTTTENYHNKEWLLSSANPDSDKIKIAQFDSNIIRAVITSKDAKQYIPIFSSDSQSVLLINPAKLNVNSIAKTKANITTFKYNKNLSTDDFTLTFDNPVVWSFKRNKDDFYVYFFNAIQYNEINFKNGILNTPYGNVELALLKNTGIRLKLPVNDNTDINTYLSGDGKSFRIRSSNLPPVKIVPQKETPIIPFVRLSGGKSVVLDAGHGGTDYGAIRDGINEKDINLDVARRVESILKRKGFKVCMTRNEDIFVSLEDRCVITNNVQPSLFVSIHVNSCMGTEPKGIETHYYHENSIDLAKTIHAKLIKAINTTNRGLFKSKFYVINHTEVPAVLLEIGFISNAAERAELVTERRKQITAQAIAEGIIEYYNKYK